jgi:hypothetical protein
MTSELMGVVLRDIPLDKVFSSESSESKSTLID